MFRRRTRRTLARRTVEFVWPRMGWRRAWSYWGYRLKRLPGTPYSIACGFACGAAVSFTPFIGFHFILGGVIAWLMRGNLLAAALGTVVGNPWTFPFIWAGIYWLGRHILGQEAVSELPQQLTMEYIFREPVTVLLPMSVGGAPTAVFVWLLCFLPLRQVIANYQRHRQQLRLHKRQSLGAEAPFSGRSLLAPGEPPILGETSRSPLAADAPLDIPDPDAPGEAAEGETWSARG